MNQYTITEENDWEGETFSYVMDLTDEEFNYINDRIGSIDALSIEPTTHTKESVKIINDHSDNSYKDRINFYKFKDDLFEMIRKGCDFIDNDPESEDTDEEKSDLKESILYDEIFYKGKGLIKITN